MTPTRRDVVAAGARLVPGMVLAPGVLALSACAGRGVGSPGSGSAGPTGDVLPLGRLEELPPGSGQATTYRGTPVVLLNVDGEVRIFSAICSHEGCTVDWSPRERIFQCPCHDGRFSADGTVIEGPPPAPLLQLEARVREGMIYVVEGEG